MDFSEAYKCSCDPSPCFSPNGKLLAVAAEYRLIIREAESLKVLQLYSCLDRIDKLEWSSNSLYVMCGLYSRSIVQIWSVDQPEWTCKIDEGPAGVDTVRWSPDGASVLVVASFQIRTTVWSLLEKRCFYLPGPKSSGDRVMSFSHDGRFMAQLERYECKDHISVYDTKSWKQLQSFPIDTSDGSEISWSPDDSSLAVLDSPLHYKLCVYALSSARLLASYSAYSDALGARTMAWSASGEMIAVGSFDQRARVLDHITWQPMMECVHEAKLEGAEGVAVYREVEERPAGASSTSYTPGGSTIQGRSKYVVVDPSLKLPHQEPSLAKPNPKMGVAKLSWSPDGSFLTTLNESTPNCVWIWDMACMELAAVLIHTTAVKQVSWAPKGANLSVVTATSKVYLWSPAGASIVHIPLQGFRAQGICWEPLRGKSFVLTDSDTFCCAYMSD